MCLFGGTFDPPHNGHFIIADAIRQILDLNKIIFIPAYNPPHKYAQFPVTPVEHRLAMLELCTRYDEHFEINDLEIQRGGISYTIETIRQIKSDNQLKTGDIYFLIGSDSLIEFKTWYHWEAILAECKVVVARRPRFEKEAIDPEILEQVLFLNLPRIEISSTDVRERFLKGQMTRFYISDAVYDYIEANGLYRTL
ncbi:MAG: nicotinate-nucleotide adenylyltransferase [Lentisphaeria bacterium]|nr:nicotinate-nucleotide adenylyltransferase [Candidatus Neomarinimicrobiota bacterium]MCF7842147.1 nicotinate-nucleotide adenylyltransferase [Lentisphaeria bacterium]